MQVNKNTKYVHTQNHADEKEGYVKVLLPIGTILYRAQTYKCTQ